MDKEKALMQAEINNLSDDAARYSYAFDLLMEYFDMLPIDVQKTLDKRFKEIDL